MESNYFKEQGKDDWLKALAKPYIVGEQDFLYVQKPIITEEGYINFAIRAAQEIRSYNPNQIEALMYLVEYLESAEPTYSTELQNGTMITINNKKALHRRKITDEPGTKIINRLALRGFGDMDMDQNTR